MLSSPVTRAATEAVTEYLRNDDVRPLFMCGDALTTLREFPPESIDCCMTSPPYWGQREYAAQGIGLENDPRDYVEHLAGVCWEVRRVLKATGSLWLNMGDAYLDKQLLGLPWRLALELVDHQGWVLRNDVIWNKVKGGPDTAQDKLGNVHEYVFHLVKERRGYYYDVNAIRSRPRSARVSNGAVVSATGVRGVRYQRQIELSTELTAEEKQAALQALDGMLREIAEGRLADFRMIIRGAQRATHSDAERVSGRARELRERGFYFLRYHPNGSKPRDVWDILPEDTQKRSGHFAPYPQDLCKIPILATCPAAGVVLDPFAGTGTTMLVAFQLGRKSVGIELSDEYVALARERCRVLL